MKIKKRGRVLGAFALVAGLATGVAPPAVAQTTAGEHPDPSTQPAAKSDKQHKQADGSVLLGTVLVKGTGVSATGSRAEALELKKQAPNMIEVQPLSEIRKLPDVNVAEALQRLPGISLETDSGEGRFINIRGLDAALNGTTYGDVRLPASNPASAFGQGRAVALDTVPSGMVGGLILTETNRPDQDAEALGGTVELVPRTGEAHGGRFFTEATLGGGYKPLHSSPVYNGDVTIGGSFGLGDGIGDWFSGPKAFSALLTASYYDEQLPIDDFEEDYSDQQSAGVPGKMFADSDMRYYNYQRRRYGIGGTLTARGNADNSFYLRFLVSGYTENKHTWHLGLNGLDSGCDTSVSPADCSAAIDPSNPNGFLAPGAQASRRLEDNRERIQTTLGELGGTSSFDAATLDYHVAYAKGEDHVPWAYGTKWVDPNAVALAYDNISDPRYPAFHTVDGTNLADPANYMLDSIARTSSYDSDRILSQALNVTVPLQLISDADQLKFGLHARELRNSHHESEVDASPINPMALSQLQLGNPVTYYADHYDIGGIPNYNQLRGIYNDPALVTYSSDPAADASNTRSGREDVYAAYAEYSTTLFDKLGMLAGVRAEQTHAKYAGNIYNSDNDTNTPASQVNSYTNYFPTLEFRYPFRDDLIGRFSLSSAIARPGFDQITPGAQVSPASQTVSVGNPGLRPTTGDNYDLSLGWYPAPQAIVSLDLFDKEFSNYILPSVSFTSNFPDPALAGELVQVTTYNNGTGRAHGLEAQVSDKFSFLPAPFDGLGASANATLVHSRATVANSGFNGQLPSTSPLTWNAAVFYEKGPAEIRLAADYVSQNLFGFGSTAAQDIYSRRRLTLDLGAQYQLKKWATVYFTAKNLLNTPLEFTEGKSDTRPIQREFYDITFAAGVRILL